MLSGMGAEDAHSVVDRIRETIEALDLGPKYALGVATAYPTERTTRDSLLTSAKNALSQSYGVTIVPILSTVLNTTPP